MREILEFISGFFTRDEINIPLPHNIHVEQPYTYLIYCLVCILLLGYVLKLFNKCPNLREGIVSALGIVVLYLFCTVIYTYQIPMVSRFLTPLPFVSFEGQSLEIVLCRYLDNGVLDIVYFSNQVASMLLLSFCVSQIYKFRHGNLKGFGWFCFRFITTFFCIGANFAANYLQNMLLAYVPEGTWRAIIELLPIGLICTLAVMLFIGYLKKFMVHVLKVVNPTFEGLSGFFFTNKFGTMVTRAICATTLLAAFTYYFQHQLEQVYETAAIPLTVFPGLTGIFVLVMVFMIWLFVCQKL